MLALLLHTACDDRGPTVRVTPSPLSEPQIVLVPNRGRVDTAIEVEGSRFPPGMLINIYVGEEDSSVIPEALISVTTDAEGEFHSSFMIPGQWPNGDPVIERSLIIAATSEDYSATAVAEFSVEPGGDTSSPTLAVIPNAGKPGDTVMITGLDFAPGTVIALQLGVPQSGFDEEPLAIVTADDAGQIEVEIELPVLWPESDAPVIEETLIIGAVDEEVGQTLATTTFENTATGIDQSTDEPWIELTHEAEPEP